MQLTHEEWMAMPEIVFPWHVPETKVTLTKFGTRCSVCRTELKNWRGEMYESFGVIEMRIAGFCDHCQKVNTVRSRMNLKQGTFIMEAQGKWHTFQMLKQSKWFKVLFWFKRMLSVIH